MLNRGDLDTSDPVKALYNRLISYEKARKLAEPEAKLSAAAKTFLITLGFLILAVLCFWGQIKAPQGTYISLFLQILAELFITLSVLMMVITPVAALTEIIPALPDLWRNSKLPLLNILLESRRKLDEQDFGFIAELREAYDRSTLTFVAKRLESRVTHLRENYVMMIGPPSQLRIVLVLVAVVQASLASSFRSFIATNKLTVSEFGFVFVLLVVFAVKDQAAGQRLEELSQLLQLAADSVHET